METKRYCKFLLGDVSNESRDKREISVLIELGYEVVVLCSGYDGNDAIIDQCTVVVRQKSKYQNKTTPKVFRILIILKRSLALIKELKRSNTDVISCHDLYALCLGYISKTLTFGRKKPLLVYDSHEFEVGRNSERSRIKGLFIQKLEKFLIKRCAFSIMVNDSIADEVQKIHHLKDRPVVVRSTPWLFKIDDDKCKTRRKELCKNLNVDEDTFIIMYHGGIMQNRGIESAIKVLSLNKEIVCVILGNGDSCYISELKHLSEELKVTERVLFHNAVSINVLWQYIGAVDVGIITIPAVCKSYYYMLPNKFFENIQAETPVIVSNFPEVERITKKYNIGLLCDPESIEEINECIEKMRTDKLFYDNIKENIKTAKKDLCWENEKKVLINAYSALK